VAERVAELPGRPFLAPADLAPMSCKDMPFDASPGLAALAPAWSCECQPGYQRLQNGAETLCFDSGHCSLRPDADRLLFPNAWVMAAQSSSTVYGFLTTVSPLKRAAASYDAVTKITLKNGHR